MFTAIVCLLLSIINFLIWKSNKSLFSLWSSGVLSGMAISMVIFDIMKLIL
jgi:hypothetical protein